MTAIGEQSLAEVLRSTQDQVRKEPARAQHRIFLFQLLCLLGQWERALNQLNVLAEIDVASLPMVHTYRQALQCEGLRAQVFAGQRSPLIVGKPCRWMALLLEALRMGALGHAMQAKALRNEAFELAEATPGRIDDPGPTEFAWIADADERFGPMIEAILDGKYYWIPFERVSALHLEAPHDLRDLVWMPAFFVWRNGGESPALIPTRYPGSEQSTDERILKASLTDWIDSGDGLMLGLGQRMLATDQGEFPLMDLRSLHLDPVSTAAEEEPPLATTAG